MLKKYINQRGIRSLLKYINMRTHSVFIGYWSFCQVMDMGV